MVTGALRTQFCLSDSSFSVRAHFVGLVLILLSIIWPHPEAIRWYCCPERWILSSAQRYLRAAFPRNFSSSFFTGIPAQLSYSANCQLLSSTYEHFSLDQVTEIFLHLLFLFEHLVFSRVSFYNASPDYCSTLLVRATPGTAGSPSPMGSTTSPDSCSRRIRPQLQQPHGDRATGFQNPSTCQKSPIRRGQVTGLFTSSSRRIRPELQQTSSTCNRPIGRQLQDSHGGQVTGFLSASDRRIRPQSLGHPWYPDEEGTTRHHRG